MDKKEIKKKEMERKKDQDGAKKEEETESVFLITAQTTQNHGSNLDRPLRGILHGLLERNVSRCTNITSIFETFLSHGLETLPSLQVHARSR